MKKRLINLAKIAIVVGLVAYVLSNIQWHDTITHLGGGEESEHPIQGTILGQWDTAEIRFQPAESSEVLTVNRDDSSTVVSPGIFTYFRTLDYFYFYIGVLLLLATVLFAATRWWWLMRANDLDVSLFDSVRYTWLGLFFNNVIPGQTGGDLVKAIYIARRCSGDRVPAFMSVIVDRVLGLASLALLAAIVVTFNTERFFEIAVAIWSLLLVGLVIATVFFSRRLRALLGLNRLMRTLPEKLQHLLKEIDAAIYHYRSHKTGIAVWLALGILNHVVSVSGVVMFGIAIGVGIPAVEYFVLVPVINIVSAIPIAPNGWGIGEALYAKLFANYGATYLPDASNAELIMSTRGIAVSILYRIVFTVLSLLGGLVLLFEKQRVSKREIAEIAGEDAHAEAKDRR